MHGSPDPSLRRFVLALDSDMPSICYICIGDRFLSAEIKDQENLGRCKYCDKTCEALPIETLADRVHEVIEEHFELVPSEPTDGDGLFLQRVGLWPDGDPVANVISGVTLLRDEIADDLRELLHERHDRWGNYKDSLEVDDLYGTESFYKERDPDDSPFPYLWTRFQREIRSKSRFFSVNAKELLDLIFGDLHTYEAFDQRPVIREIGPGDDDRFVWRARVAQSTEQLETILKSPTKEIGPPVSQWEKDGRIRPRGGRMNAPGISVFYGARDMATCVDEVRPPVGSHVVVARFEVLRTLRLLDLDALERIYVETSYFDPESSSRLSQALFLQRLASEISRPVMPQDETTEYLTTQAMAEYLANQLEPALDGILYRSSQTTGNSQNLVLFNHARRVKGNIMPVETKVIIPSLSTGHSDSRYEPGDIHVYEPAPPDPLPAEMPSSTEARGRGFYLNLTKDGSPDIEEEDQGDSEPEPYYEPTLRMDLESVVVLNITRARYCSESIAVRWHRS